MFVVFPLNFSAFAQCEWAPNFDVDTDTHYEQDARRYITQHVKRYGVLLFSSVLRQEELTIQDLYTFHKHTIIHPLIRLPITHSLFPLLCLHFL